MVREVSGCVLGIGIWEKEKGAHDGMKGHDSFNNGSADPANTGTECINCRYCTLLRNEEVCSSAWDVACIAFLC